MSTRQTEIYICSGVLLDNRYVHSIRFETASDQLSYFAGKVVTSFSGYSYCRKTWDIQVHGTLEDAVKWTYLYFRNEPSGKWWYYFINQVEYVNDNTVKLTLELDVIQTYMFDWELRPCFIERQHSYWDNIVNGWAEEDIDVGELDTVAWQDITEIEELCVLVLATYNPLTTNADFTDTVLASRYNNVFGGMGVFAVDLSSWQAWGAKLKLLSDAGKIDGIVSMWMYPKNMVNLASDSAWGDGDVCHPVASVNIKTTTLSMDARFMHSWTPRNKRLYGYPFRFLQVSNNQGTSAIFRFEQFLKNDGSSVYDGTTFRTPVHLYGGYSPDATVKMVFPEYCFFGHESAVSLGGYPTCAWNADAYKIWLAQNQNSMNVSTALSGLSIVGGAATAAASAYMGNVPGVVGGLGAMVSGGKNIADQVAMKKDREVQPPQARGAYSASTNIMQGKQTFTAYIREVSNHQARIIDDYFTLYGYAVKRVEVPSIYNRRAYTYVKTVGCTIGGNIGNDDRVKIESIFDNGITFWTHGDRIGKYGQENTPLGEMGGAV